MIICIIFELNFFFFNFNKILIIISKYILNNHFIGNHCICDLYAISSFISTKFNAQNYKIILYKL